MRNRSFYILLVLCLLVPGSVFAQDEPIPVPEPEPLPAPIPVPLPAPAKTPPPAPVQPAPAPEPAHVPPPVASPSLKKKPVKKRHHSRRIGIFGKGLGFGASLRGGLFMPENKFSAEIASSGINGNLRLAVGRHWVFNFSLGYEAIHISSGYNTNNIPLSLSVELRFFGGAFSPYVAVGHTIDFVWFGPSSQQGIAQNDSPPASGLVAFESHAGLGLSLRLWFVEIFAELRAGYVLAPENGVFSTQTLLGTTLYF